MGGEARIVSSVIAVATAEIAGRGLACAPPPETAAPGGASAAPSLRGFVALLQGAAAALDEPGLGWAIGGRYALRDLGAVGAAAESAPTLGAALALLCDAFAAVQTDTALTLQVADGRARLAYRILDPDIWPRDQDAALTLAVFAGLAARAAGPGWRPLALRFEHPRTGPDSGPEALTGAAARYRADDNALVLQETLLDRPMPAADRERFRRIAPGVLGSARAQEQAASLRRRTALEIWRRLGAGPVDRRAVAAAVGLSERTFRRRLDEEGAGFSDILAECRLRLARRMLACWDRPTADLAARLGYSDATAFERAFRRGTGLTPAEHRRAARRAG